MQQLTFIYRKRNPSFFSIEKVFQVLEQKLAPMVDLRHIELPFTSRGLVSIFFNLLYLRKYKKGLFHITGDVHYAILALPPERTILTIHDLVFLHTYKGIRRRILKWLYLDLPLKRAKYITTISEKSKQEILEYGKFDADRIIIIPNPVEPTFHHFPQGWSDEPTVLFLGTKQNKNLELSIAALYNLPVKLHIIGELTTRQKALLEKYRIKHHQQERIPQEQLVEAFKTADLLLFPSTYEGFGLPVIEAFQSGRPVITSDLPPMNDVAQGAALLIDPTSIVQIRNAVIRVCQDEQLRNDMVAKGLEVVAAHQVTKIVDAYMGLWNKLKTQ